MPTVTKATPKKTVKKKTTTKRKNVKRKPPVKESVVDRIVNVSDTLTDRLSFLIYGKSGSGKTTLACTFPKPLLLLGAEKGTKSVHDVKEVDFVQINESGELTELIQHVIDGQKYQTVVLDTASILQEIITREVLEVDELPAQGSWGMASREKWGQIALQTKERLRALINLAERDDVCDVVITAQEREFNNEGDSEIIAPYVGAALAPSVTNWLNPACDYIAQTVLRPQMKETVVTVGKKKIRKKVKTGKTVFSLRVSPDEVYTTKFRLPKGTKLPDFLDDATYPAIRALIKGG